MTNTLLYLFLFHLPVNDEAFSWPPHLTMSLITWWEKVDDYGDNDNADNDNGDDDNGADDNGENGNGNGDDGYGDQRQ